MVPQIIMLALLSLVVKASSNSIKDTQTYIVHVDTSKISSALESSLVGTKPWHQFFFESLLKISSPVHDEAATPTPELFYVYDTVLSGFAAKLTSKQAASLQKIDGFLYAYPDDMLLSLHTSHSPQFLRLKPGHGLWGSQNVASEIIVGVIDSGIWPEHASFHDTHLSGFPRRWKGACEPGKNFSSNNCNKKLIGARAFWKGYEAFVGPINETKEYKSARDSQGHGTHTASTAAGSVVPGASLFGNAKGSASGMAYNARIAAYKACWGLGCANSDVLAAVDRAVADGVDVLSLSLGGGSQPFYSDTVATAAFGAVRKGVFVSCSAGNSGPSESSVSNGAPWIMTVAASYLDRNFPTLVKLGDGRTFRGASLYSGKPTKQSPIVYASTAGSRSSARYCSSDSLSKSLVKGKIVICDRGLNSRTQKGEQVKLAGGAGVLLPNTEDQGEELFAEPHVLPASSMGTTASSAIKNYLLSTKKPTASITFLGTEYGNRAPMVTAFSSRGPSWIGPDIIKPDVTAPGMSILAAWPPTVSPSFLASDKRSVLFNVIAGTSMSCPHVSGLAALLKSVHRDWSPAAIKSALMTTAYTTDNRNKSIIDISTGMPATPFIFGSGHVDPEKASNPGLIYDIAPRDYLDYLCGLNYTSEQMAAFARKSYSCSSKRVRRANDLNYPSFSVLFDGGRKKAAATHTRTVTNVGAARCRYVVDVRAPDGVAVDVEPKVMEFSRVGQKLSYRVKFVNMGGNGYSFGELVWRCGGFAVRSPVAVAWQ